MSPLKSPLSPEIYSSIFFEYNQDNDMSNDKLATIDFMLWERLSYQNVYPNVSLLRPTRSQSESSSKSGSIKGFMKRLSWRKKSDSDNNHKGEVAVLSLPGLTSSTKAVNDLGKEVKTVPLSSSLLLLSQTRSLLYPEGAWYYNYLDSVSVELIYRMSFVCAFLILSHDYFVRILLLKMLQIKFHKSTYVM